MTTKRKHTIMIIKNLKIGYQIVKIMEETSSVADTFGQYDTERSIIRININHEPVEIVNTLVHECLHAICYTYGLRLDDEEKICLVLANGLTQVFRDNKNFLTFIEENLYERKKEKGTT